MQLRNLHNRMAVGSENFFFHVEIWAKNTNPQHPHTRFATSNNKFPREALYNTKKPPRIILDLRVEPILAVFSFNASKLIRVLVFRLFFLRYLASPKNKVIAVNLYQN